MTVTEIRPLDKRRSKVRFEEGFALALYQGEIRRYEIEEGKELSEEDYHEIVHVILHKRAKERVLYILKSSDKTETDLRKKLVEAYYPESAIDYALCFAKEYGYVDDESYAKRYIGTYSRRKSHRRIAFELQQKGISREQIENLFEENPVDEKQQIECFLMKKGYDGNTVTREEKNKLYAALCRKGFSYEIIGEALRKTN